MLSHWTDPGAPVRPICGSRDPWQSANVQDEVTCPKCLDLLIRRVPPIDPVSHPAHYTQHPSGIECIDVIEHMSLPIGNAIKYLWRAGLKSEETHVEDLRKAIWYINREIERVQRADPR